MTNDIAGRGAGSTDFECLAHYHELAGQFRQWAEEETVPEAREGMLDMAGNTSSWRVIGDARLSLVPRAECPSLHDASDAGTKRRQLR